MMTGELCDIYKLFNFDLYEWVKYRNKGVGVGYLTQ